MEEIRVATFAGPGAEGEELPVPAKRFRSGELFIK